MAEVRFLDAAIDDLNGLDGAALKAVFTKLAQLEKDPTRGLPLGSKSTSNLTSFRKIVAGDNTYRIVYRVEPGGDICVVWVIAGRADSEVYAIAKKRLADLGENAPARALLEALDMLTPRVARRLPEQ